MIHFDLGWEGRHLLRLIRQTCPLSRGFLEACLTSLSYPCAVSNVFLEHKHMAVKLLPILILIFIAILVPLGIIYQPVIMTAILSLSSWIEQNQIKSMVIYSSALGLSSLVLFPTTLPSILAGALFPLPLAIVVVITGEQLGIIASFAIGRTVLQSVIDKYTRSDARFQAINDAVAKNGVFLVFLLRLTPIFPFGTASHRFSSRSLQLHIGRVKGKTLGRLSRFTRWKLAWLHNTYNDGFFLGTHRRHAFEI